MTWVNFTKISVRDYLRDPGVHAPSEVERYLHGECHIFAIALFRLTALPILTITEPRFSYSDGRYIEGLVHAVCYDPSIPDLILDAKGWRDITHLKDEYYIHEECSYRTVDDTGCERLVCIREPLNPQAVQNTIDFIQKHGYLEKINA